MRFADLLRRIGNLTLRRIGVLGLVLGMFAAIGSGRSADAPGPDTLIVRQVDHVLAASTHPGELFSFLTETLQLPVAWPMANYGSFASGGVCLGNVNLEILKDPGTSSGSRRAHFTGLALEPAPLNPVTIPVLDARGIRHGPPAPFPSPGLFGFRKPRWTTLSLPEISGEFLEVFFCEYHEDIESRRRDLRRQLESRKGGPIGILRAREITYGTPKPDRLGAQWGNLLKPLREEAPHQWSIGPGPGIRLKPSASGTAWMIVLEVRSLSEARSALPGLGLEATADGDTLKVAGAPLQGMPLLLVAPLSRTARD